MLSYCDFTRLAVGQQDRYVRQQGQYLGQRWHENYSIELYQVADFYCELWLEQECAQPPVYRVYASAECRQWYAASSEQGMY